MDSGDLVTYHTYKHNKTMTAKLLSRRALGQMIEVQITGDPFTCWVERDRVSLKAKLVKQQQWSTKMPARTKTAAKVAPITAVALRNKAKALADEGWEDLAEWKTMARNELEAAIAAVEAAQAEEDEEDIEEDVEDESDADEDDEDFDDDEEEDDEESDEDDDEDFGDEEEDDEDEDDIEEDDEEEEEPVKPAKRGRPAKAVTAPASKTIRKPASKAAAKPARTTKAATAKVATSKKTKVAEPVEDEDLPVNPFRDGSNQFIITKLLMNGGTRSKIVQKLEGLIELRQRNGRPYRNLANELDIRVVRCADVLKKTHGFTVKTIGRGPDAKIKAIPPTD